MKSSFYRQSPSIFLLGVQSLIKSTPGVNFTNIVSAFMLGDPESVKKIDNLTVFFTRLGSACVKAVHRTLMKLSPGVYLTNIFHAAFVL